MYGVKVNDHHVVCHNLKTWLATDGTRGRAIFGEMSRSIWVLPVGLRSDNVGYAMSGSSHS